MSGMRQDKTIWELGRLDGIHGKPWQCPPACDRVAYAAGYVEGRAKWEAEEARIAKLIASTTSST